MKLKSLRGWPGAPAAFTAPFLVVLAAFWAIPIAEGFLLSLQADGLSDTVEWVGIAHYRELLRDSRFFHALGNTALYAAGTICLIVPFSIALAVALRQVWPKLRGVLGFCLLLPGLTPPTVLAFLFLLVFNGPRGLLNALFVEPLGFGAVDWIQDPRFIKVSLILQAVWRWTGFTTFFLLAGMEGIPGDYYAMARAEGAGVWQVLRHVTLPMLRNVLIFVSVFLFLDAFTLFEGAYVLLGSSGGTADAGLLLIGYTYQTAFTFGRFGQAAAMSFGMAPLLLLTVWSAFFWAGREGRRSPRGEVA